MDRTRELEAALGNGIKRVEANEEQTVVLQRRSIRAARDIAAGEVIRRADVAVLRPCPSDAMPPYHMDRLLGMTLARTVTKGDHIRMQDVAW